MLSEKPLHAEARDNFFQAMLSAPHIRSVDSLRASKKARVGAVSVLSQLTAAPATTPPSTPAPRTPTPAAAITPQALPMPEGLGGRIDLTGDSGGASSCGHDTAETSAAGSTHIEEETAWDDRFAAELANGNPVNPAHANAIFANAFTAARGKEEQQLTEALCSSGVDLKLAIEKGDLDLRGALGQKFAREHKTNSATWSNYNLDKTYDAKKKFRVDWCKAQLARIIESKVQVKSYQKVDRKKGTYMPFGVLVEQYGIHYDRPAAIQAALRYAASCVKMGGNWCFYDPMSSIVHFLHLKREWMQEVGESWQIFKTETEGGEVVGAIGVGPVPALADGAALGAIGAAPLPALADGALEPVTAKLPKKGGAAGKGAKGGAAGKAEKGETPPKEKEKKSVFAEVSQQALQLKSKYNAAVATATNLVAMVEAGSPTWEWANNTRNIGALKADLALLNSGLTEFQQQLIVTDIKTLKESFGAEHLIVQLQEWVAKKEAVDQVMKQSSRLTKMHKQSIMS